MSDTDERTAFDWTWYAPLGEERKAERVLVDPGDLRDRGATNVTLAFELPGRPLEVPPNFHRPTNFGSHHEDLVLVAYDDNMNEIARAAPRFNEAQSREKRFARIEPDARRFAIRRGLVFVSTSAAALRLNPALDDKAKSWKNIVAVARLIQAVEGVTL